MVQSVVISMYANYLSAALAPATPTLPNMFSTTTMENMCRNIALNHYGSKTFPVSAIGAFLDDYLLPSILGVPRGDAIRAGVRKVLADHYRAVKNANDVDTPEYMFKRFKAEGLEDKVTFASIGVFGRTLSKTRNGDGRDHNLHHHVTLLAGKNVKGGVVGGLRKVGNDFGAMPIDAATGQASDRGNVPLDESLESTAKTIATACGLPRDVMNTRVKRKDDNGEDKNVGRIITGALV